MDDFQKQSLVKLESIIQNTSRIEEFRTAFDEHKAQDSKQFGMIIPKLDKLTWVNNIQVYVISAIAGGLFFGAGAFLWNKMSQPLPDAAAAGQIHKEVRP